MNHRHVLAAAALTLTAALTGCQPGTAPRPVAVPPPPASSPAGPGQPAPGGSAAQSIGVTDPHAGRAAGAELGEASHVPATSIAALPAPAGKGAQPRGTQAPVVFHGPRDRKRIALTFDSNMTDSMLRKLAAGQVKSYANTAVVDELQRTRTPATFFLAGKWVEAYPALTRRIAADPGFELASHSWAHEGFRAGCYGLGTIARDGMAADVERSFQVLGRFTDHPSRYFRFPGGCYDKAALAAIAPVGCTVVEYDDVSGDAFGSDPRRIAADTVAQARPGSIVVLHITEANAPKTAQALPSIIKQLRDRGFQLVTLGDLLS
ncbi:polysaccharide deacetylase family protein [Krasilnikovia sp. MM14-A1259]|uniref:polysaccharide deacetylase family protein n=1 Tax=Krasilnikovia sp. MM14-A1259 TaxID=3373539 RepID=UPI003818AE45